jgi:hypothetical protein
MDKPNGAAAARAAGFSVKGAGVQATRLLKDKTIRARVAELEAELLATPERQAKALERDELFDALTEKGKRVVRELETLAFSDIADYVEYVPGTEVLVLKPLENVPEERRRAIKSLRIKHEKARGEDGVDSVTYEIQLWDKPGALRLLAQRHKLVPSDDGRKGKDGEPAEGEVWRIRLTIPKATGEAL